MLRFLFPLLALGIAGLSIAVGFVPHSANSQICRNGGCRFDQILASAATPANVSALLNEDPDDPGVWCTYGEFWSAHGDDAKASAAFDRAIHLGSGLSPVLMRVANFDFTHNRKEEGLRLVPRILSLTPNFDGIVFSYVGISGEPVSRLLGTAIPPTSRAAHSWLDWVQSHGSEQDFLDTWTWMRQNGLADEKSAVEVTSTVWQRKAYRTAQELWADWLGAHRGDYLKPQLLANTGFQDAPSGTPFSWQLVSNKSVEFKRRDGLDVHFLGQENLTTAGVRQLTAVEPGRYRFSAEVSAANITTDEGLFFQITDAENAGRLNVETQPVGGNNSRTWIGADFVVAAGTRIIQIQLARHPSHKSYTEIQGTLHIYRVSLIPASRT